MITLAEIAKLPYNVASVKKIDLFLSSAIKGSNEYIKATCYKCIILHKTGKTNDALKQLYLYIPEFNKLDSESVIDICDAIMEICIDVKRYDQAVKYMSIKKDYLSISNLHLYLKDQIRLYLDMREYDRAKLVLEKYLEDDITKEEEIFALDKLLEIYFANMEYDKFNNKVQVLEDYYKDNLMLDKLAILTYEKIYIDFSNKNYIKVISEMINFLRENKENTKYEIMGSTILMKCYIACSDLKKASIVEADYEEFLSGDYIEESIEFCYTALDLYTRMNAIISITEYHNRIAEYEKLKEPKRKALKKNKEEDFSNIVIPVIEIPEANIHISDNAKERILNGNNNDNINNQEIILKEKSKKVIEISKEFKSVEEILDNINNSNLTMRLRDVFRIIGMEINKSFGILEMYLLYSKVDLVGLHYKMERAYDKKPIRDEIKDTLNYASYIYDAEMFLDDNDRKYNINIVNKEEYPMDIYGYSLPLHNSVGVIGSILFISDRDFVSDENVYESLKLITKVFNTRLIFEIDNEAVKYNNQKTFFIIDNMAQGIKEESNGYIHLNENAREILGTLEDLTISDFINGMEREYQSEYKRINNEINELLSTNISFEYKYRKDKDSYVYVKEIFYPIMMDGNLVIFSLIEDITNYKNEKKELLDLAYTNPISKKNTELKLLMDLKEINDIPYALAIIEVDDFKLYSDLYGFNFTNQLIYALGDKLEEAIKNEFRLSLYHLERDRYAILFKDFNDKRVVDSKLKFILINVSKSLHSINSRVNLIFNVGAYKVNRGEEIAVDSVISYCLDALNDAVLLDTDCNHICHYNSQLSKVRFYNNNLVTTISEAIDKNKLGINYQQIVNLENLSVYAYFIKMTLDNYEVDYNKLIEIAKRKNLIKDIDRYLISNAIIDLKMLYDKYKGFFNVILPIHKEYIDEASVKRLSTLINHYKVNPNFIIILCDDFIGIENIMVKYKELGIKVATRNLVDVLTGIPNILMYDYHNKVSNSSNDVMELVKKYNCLIIFDEINEKNDIIYAKDNNFGLVYGKYYKRLKRMKNIIEDLAKH